MNTTPGEAPYHGLIRDRRRVPRVWNETSMEYPRDACLHELFEKQVERTPDAIALGFGDLTLSYEELNVRANRLAHHLISLKVSPEVIVGVCLENSPELVIAILAILKAGGAYMPLDTSHPEERIAAILEESGAPLILSSRGQKNLPTSMATVLRIDEPIPGIEEPRKTNPVRRVTSKNLAYVIYTSGSTGRPKGVPIHHRAPCNCLHWAKRHLPIGPGDVFLQTIPSTFDPSVFEIFNTLISGARLQMIKPGGQREGDYLTGLILQHAVTVLSVVPTTLRMIVEDGRFGSIKSLRRVYCGGEALPLDLMKRFHWDSSAQLLNMYGPTEATIFSTVWVCNREWRGRQPPIGKPIANTRVHILDEKGEALPVGLPGELFLGGDGVARGYLNRPDLTAERFLPDPFSGEPASRLYRTGDLASWNPDGTITCHGRVDNQIKLRGFRIEPEEIEEALLRCPQIGRALVLCREGSPGRKELVAYCVPAIASSFPGSAELRSHLASILPDYMIPSAFVRIGSIPLTSNGKIDRRALPAHSGMVVRNEAEYPGPPPSDLLKQRLLELWKKNLGKNTIGLGENFFDLGGNSLSAAALARDIELLTGTHLPVAAIFQSQTIDAQTAYLREHKACPAWSSVVPMQAQGAKTPLFVLHGVGGDVFAHVHWARTFAPDRPVYGIQAVGLDGRSKFHRSIESMAAHYTRQIREIQPAGPYHLVGFSMGGWIAHAVADQLLREGQLIGMMGVLDTSACMRLTLRDRLEMLTALFSEWCSVNPPDDALDSRRTWRQRVAHDLKTILNSARQRTLPYTRRGAPEHSEMHGRHGANPGADYFARLCRDYRPARIDALVDLFVPADRSNWMIKLWNHYACRGVRIHRILECHDDFIKQDIATGLGALISRTVDQAEERHRKGSRNKERARSRDQN